MIEPNGARALGDRALREIATHLPCDRNSLILEVGCGPGALLTALKEQGYSNLHGLDLSETLAGHGGQFLDVNIAVGEWQEHLLASPDCYSVIVALDVLEHIRAAEWIPTLQATCQRLLPGGRLILRVPNPECPLVLPTFYGDITHVAMATPDLLRHLLTEAGFRGPITVSETRPNSFWKRLVFTAVHKAIVSPALRVLYYHFYGRSPKLLTRNYYCFAYANIRQ